MAAIRIFASAPLRLSLVTRSFSQASIFSQSSSTVPRVVSSSMWDLVIPKAFRHPNDPVSVAEREKRKLSKSKEWNPATFFIAMAILIGSNAIQMIALRNEKLQFSRHIEAQLALLRETIERVKKGEDVDVEKVLGTGDPAREKEWEEVMEAIGEDGDLPETKDKKQDQAEQKHRKQDQAEQKNRKQDQAEQKNRKQDQAQQKNRKQDQLEQQSSPPGAPGKNAPGSEPSAPYKPMSPGFY